MNDFKLPNLPPLPAPVFVPPPKRDDKKESTSAQHARDAAFKYGSDGKLLKEVQNRGVDPAQVRDTDLEEQQNAMSQELGSDKLTTGNHPQLVKSQVAADKKLAKQAQANGKKGGAYTGRGKGGAKLPVKAPTAAKVTAPQTFADYQRADLQKKLGLKGGHGGDVFQAAAGKKGQPKDPNLSFIRFSANPQGNKKGPADTGLRSGDQMARMPNTGGQFSEIATNPDPALLRQLSAQANASKRPSFQQRALENPAFALFQKARGDKGSGGAVSASSGGSSGPSLLASAGGPAPKGNQNPISGLAASLRGGLGKMDQVQAPASNLVAIDSSKTFKPNPAIAMTSTNMWGGGMAPSVSMDTSSVATALNGAVLGLPAAVSQKKIA